LGNRRAEWARRLNVSPSTVYMLRRGETWAHLEHPNQGRKPRKRKKELAEAPPQVPFPAPRPMGRGAVVFPPGEPREPSSRAYRARPRDPRVRVHPRNPGSCGHPLLGRLRPGRLGLRGRRRGRGRHGRPHQLRRGRGRLRHPGSRHRGRHRPRGHARLVDMHSHAELDEDYGRPGKPSCSRASRPWRSAWTGWGRRRRGAPGRVGPGRHRRELVALRRPRLRTPRGHGHGGPRAHAGRDGSHEGARPQRHGRGSAGTVYRALLSAGSYAETEEVVELNRVAAAYAGAIYDTHDRDLGASYPPFGTSTRSRRPSASARRREPRSSSATSNPRAPQLWKGSEGAALIEEAQARGWTCRRRSTSTPRRSPTCAPTRFPTGGGRGDSAMIRRFDHRTPSA